MLTGSFTIFRLPGVTSGPKEFLEIVVDSVLLVSCSEIVTLRAQIVTNSPGHTYYWEQIGGTPVVWLEPQNQLLVTFQKPGTTGDLFFRFYVDRYTPFEQYKDTVVSGTARDDLTNYALNIGNTSSITKGTASSLYMSPINSTTTYLLQNFPANTNYVYNTNDLTLAWTNPTPTAPVIYTKSELYTVSGSVLTLVATINSPTATYQNLSIVQPNRTDTYMFRSYWTLYGGDQFTGYVDSNTVNFSSTTGFSIGENFSAYAQNIANTSTITKFQTQILELVPLEYSDIPNNALNINNTSTISTFQIQILSLINLPDNLTDTPNSAININNTSSITLFQIQTSDGIINV